MTIQLYEATLESKVSGQLQTVCFDELTIPLPLAPFEQQIKGLLPGQVAALANTDVAATVQVIDRIPAYGLVISEDVYQRHQA